MLVADEPDPRPAHDSLDCALISSAAPEDSDLDRSSPSLAAAPPQIEKLGEDDWVTMSQAGLQPIRSGRFFIHTPTQRPTGGRNLINFEIDAGLAFGTGQHADDRRLPCRALDRLEAAGKEFANIADIGTGTGLLAFAALALSSAAKSHRHRHRPDQHRRHPRECRDRPGRARPQYASRFCLRSPTAWIRR